MPVGAPVVAPGAVVDGPSAVVVGGAVVAAGPEVVGAAVVDESVPEEPLQPATRMQIMSKPMARTGVQWRVGGLRLVGRAANPQA